MIHSSGKNQASTKTPKCSTSPYPNIKIKELPDQARDSSVRPVTHTLPVMMLSWRMCVTKVLQIGRLGRIYKTTGYSFFEEWPSSARSEILMCNMWKRWAKLRSLYWRLKKTHVRSKRILMLEKRTRRKKSLKMAWCTTPKPRTLC